MYCRYCGRKLEEAGDYLVCDNLKCSSLEVVTPKEILAPEFYTAAKSLVDQVSYSGYRHSKYYKKLKRLIKQIENKKEL